MAHSLSLISTNLNSLVLNHHRWHSFGTLVSSPSKHKRRFVRTITRAVQETPRRLIDIIRSVPEISRNYFKKPSRRTLFGGISLLGGFYVAQTISLSFGADRPFRVYFRKQRPQRDQNAELESKTHEDKERKETVEESNKESRQLLGEGTTRPRVLGE